MIRSYDYILNPVNENLLLINGQLSDLRKHQKYKKYFSNLVQQKCYIIRS